MATVCPFSIRRPPVEVNGVVGGWLPTHQREYYSRVSGGKISNAPLFGLGPALLQCLLTSAESSTRAGGLSGSWRGPVRLSHAVETRVCLPNAFACQFQRLVLGLSLVAGRLLLLFGLSSEKADGGHLYCHGALLLRL